MRKYCVLLTLLPLVALAAACGASKSSNPLSPAVAGPIPGVSITPPKPVDPAVGSSVAVGNQPVTLVVENAVTSGVRPLNYAFQVATDVNFTNKVLERDAITPGEGRTSLRLTDSLTAERTYYWRASAQDGANSGPYSQAANFKVFTPIVINQPTPVAPVNGVTVAVLRPRFTFTNASTSGPVGAIAYAIEVSDSDSFANRLATLIVAQGPGQTSVDAAADLEYDRQCFWRVRAYDPTTTGPWSATQVFRTPPPPPVIHQPTPLTPANNATVTVLRPSFLFANAQKSGPVGALTYAVEVSDSGSFANRLAALTVAEGPGQTSVDAAANLEYDRQYFWRVRASDATTTGPWSATQAFRTPLPPPLPTPPPTPTPTPTPTGPGSCAANNGPAIIVCISAKYPERRAPVSSLNVRNENMIFLRDRIIEAGKCGGMDLGWNLKRGGPELSIDFIAWRQAGGDMGVDIGYDYDNTSATLQLSWGEWGSFGASYGPYTNSYSCSR